MNSVQYKYKPSRKRFTSFKGRRTTVILFSFLASLAVLQISQCFVPTVLQTTSHRADVIPIVQLQQQLTQIEPNKNEGGEIEIEKNVLNTNNTESSFGTLKPRNNVAEYVSDIFPRASSLKPSRAMIESTIDDMLKSTRTPMGLFGETVHSEEELKCIPKVGTVLARSIESSSSITASVATALDDLEIANLRLSVFADFNPESQKLFCERSCELLSTRRQRGATCIVATATTTTSSNNKQITIESLPADRCGGKGPIVGTAEISFHEFSETRLSYSRPMDSILYITEVAVDATYRRKGIAKLMMEAIDTLANIREVETIYLHVDVTNFGAVHLYERAGYRKLEPDNPIFLEFTTKLNLHDGATKGRNHYLMAKDLRRTTWLDIQKQHHIDEAFSIKPQRRMLGIEVMSSV